MILIVLIVAAAACIVVGVLSGSLAPAYVALSLAVLGAVVFGVATMRERLGEASREGASEADKSPDGAESVEVRQAAKQTQAAEAGTQGPAARQDLEKPAEVEHVDEEPLVPVESSEERLAAAGVVVNGRTQLHVNGSSPETGSAQPAVDEVKKVAVDEPLEENPIVYVIPGRKRFHRAGCRILEGRSAEELTVADVEDEGFTACTSCVDAHPRTAPRD